MLKRFLTPHELRMREAIAKLPKKLDPISAAAFERRAEMDLLMRADLKKLQEHLPLLVGGQEPGPTGRGRGLQPVVPMGVVPGDPLGDGDRVDAEERGHVLLRPALIHATNRRHTPRLQLRCCAFTPHPEQATNTPHE